MCFVDRTTEWGQHIDSSCRNLGLGSVSKQKEEDPPGPRLQPAAVLTQTPTVQEDSRHHKQQLLLKPTREKSQFSTVAEDVVSSAATAASQVHEAAICHA